MSQPAMGTPGAEGSPRRTPSPFAVGRDEGERLTFGGVTIVVKASAEDTAGSLTVFEEVPPLADVGLHVHRFEDEIYYVLDGEHDFVCGEQTFRLGPGAPSSCHEGSRTRTVESCPAPGGCWA